MNNNLALQLYMVLATMVAFVLMLALNEWLFKQLEFVPGVNWVYLPAGMRLLCTLLFAEAGAIGLLLVSWGVCFFYFFPNDFVRSFMGGLIAAAAPYLTYRFARYKFGLHTSLANLSSGRLLVCVLCYSIASPLLHHLWFLMRGETENIWRSFLIMALGDLNGTLIVIYTMKMLLALASRLGRA